MPTQRCPCLDDPYDSIGRRAGAREHGAAERLVRPGGPVPEPQVDSVVVAHLKGIMYFNAGASSARAFLGASAEEPQMQLRYGMNPHQAAPIESAQWGAVLHQPARRPERVATTAREVALATVLPAATSVKPARAPPASSASRQHGLVPHGPAGEGDRRLLCPTECSGLSDSAGSWTTICTVDGVPFSMWGCRPAIVIVPLVGESRPDTAWAPGA